MPDADETMRGEPLAHEPHQVIECPGVAERDAVAPRLLGDYAAVAVLRHEPRRGEQRLGLSARDEFEPARAFGEERELDSSTSPR